VERSRGESPPTGTAETVEPQAPETSQGRYGQQKKVHARIDTVCRRKHLALAWAKGQKKRGRAGIDEVPIVPFEARPECSGDLLHRQRREGTYRPPPVQRVAIPQSEGGVRQLGIPAVLDRVGPQALVQRMEPIFDPTVRASACG
jgi:RNA-directed DNA polymerase